MKLNLSKGVVDNHVEVVIPITTFNAGQGLVLVMPLGVVHKTITLKDGSDTPLDYGTDWEYGHQSRHALACYNLEAYGSILLLNNTLTGNIKAVVDYLGGCYEVHHADRIPVTVDKVGEEFPPLYWDYAQEAPYVGTEDINTLPGGSIKTSIEDVSDVLALFNTIPPAGIDQGVVEAQVNPMVNLLQDLTAAGLTTTSKDVVGGINEILAILDNVIVATIWGHEAEYAGEIRADIDLTKVIADDPVYYRVWCASANVTYADYNDDVLVEVLSYGDVIYFEGGSSNRSELIRGTEEPLTRLDRVDISLATTRKDVVGAMLELVERTNAHYASGDLFPTVMGDTDLTGYVSIGDYQIVPIGVASVTITGKYKDGTTTKTFTPDDVGVLYKDGSMEKRLLSDYPEAHVAAIHPRVDSGDRTVSGQVKDVAKVLDGLGPQLGHLITVVNRGVAPEDSIDLQQHLVTAEENSELHAMLSAAYGTEGAGAIMPPVTHNKVNGVFEKFYTFADSVINAITYSPADERYLVHRVEAGTWSFLTSYNAADDSYVNLPTVAGIDIAPADMMVVGDDLYMAQAMKLNHLHLPTNVINTIYTHTVAIKSIAVSTYRDIAYLVDDNGELFIVDLVTYRATKLETGIDKGLCVLINEVLWVGKGNELITFEVDKEVGRETRSSLGLGHPSVINVIDNSVVSVWGDLYQLESSGVLSKLGGSSAMTSLTFDSLKWGFVGSKADSLYSLTFQQTLKNFIKE